MVKYIQWMKAWWSYQLVILCAEHWWMKLAICGNNKLKRLTRSYRLCYCWLQQWYLEWTIVRALTNLYPFSMFNFTDFCWLPDHLHMISELHLFRVTWVGTVNKLHCHWTKRKNPSINACRKWSKINRAKIFDASRSEFTDGPQLFQKHTHYIYDHGWG